MAAMRAPITSYSFITRIQSIYIAPFKKLIRSAPGPGTTKENEL